MNVSRNTVEHAERPKERRWTRAATPNSQHLAASAMRRSRPNKRVHQEKGQPENHEGVQSAQRRREQLPTIPKNRKVLAEKKAREKTVVPRRGSGRREVAVPGSGCRRGSTRCDWRTSRRGTSRFSAAARRAKNLFKETPPRKYPNLQPRRARSRYNSKTLHERTVHG